MRRVLPLLALVLLARVAAAADAGLVAVLPLDVRLAHVDEESRVALEEAIRTVAGQALSPRGYTVLTGETTLAVLRDNGVDTEKACEASCALEAARELRASLFVSGTVTRSEGALVAYVRLFEPKQGRQLGAVQLEGRAVKDLRDQFAAKADGFFAEALGDASKSAAVLAGGLGMKLAGSLTASLRLQLSPEGAQVLGARRLEAEFTDQGRTARCPAPITATEGCEVAASTAGALAYRLLIDGAPDAQGLVYVLAGGEQKLVPTLSGIPWLLGGLVGVGMTVAGFVLGNAEGGLGKESAGPVLLVAFGIPLALLSGGVGWWFAAGPELELAPLTPYDERRPTKNRAAFAR